MIWKIALFRAFAIPMRIIVLQYFFASSKNACRRYGHIAGELGTDLQDLGPVPHVLVLQSVSHSSICCFLAL